MSAEADAAVERALANDVRTVKLGGPLVQAWRDAKVLAQEVVLLRGLLAVGQVDQCGVVGNENEGYCRCVRPAGHERHACQHGVWQ